MRVLLAAVVAMGVGCSDSAKVAQLQSDVEKLEHQVAELIDISGDMLESQSKFTKKLVEINRESREDTDKMIEEIGNKVVFLLDAEEKHRTVLRSILEESKRDP